MTRETFDSFLLIALGECETGEDSADRALVRLKPHLDALLQGRVSELERAWIGISDRLPPRHENVWCYNRDGVQFEGRIHLGMHKPFFTYPRVDGNVSNASPAWIDVTHWRPLPPKPKESSP